MVFLLVRGLDRNLKTNNVRKLFERKLRVAQNLYETHADMQRSETTADLMFQTVLSSENI